MKKILFVLAAVSLLYACANDSKQTQSASGSNIDPAKFEEGGILPIAVINYDSLLSQYDLALEANESLIKKQEDIRLDINQKGRQLQNEILEFQNKLENNAFLSRERAENEQRRLAKKEQDLQTLQETKSQEMLAEQQQMAQRLSDSLHSVLNTINRTGKYHLILTTNALNENVLFAAPQYDITQEVVYMMNDRYGKSK